MAKALIVGGGLGGLSAALSLNAQAMPCVVLERAPEFAEIGAGIQLAPNAWKIFDRLGLSESIAELAVFPERIVMKHGLTARELMQIPLKQPFEAHFHHPYALIHRADLHRALLRKCRERAGIELHSSANVTDFSIDADRVEVLTDDGAKWHGSILVGADGIWSQVRMGLLNDGKPRVSGHVAYRAVLPYADAPEYAKEHAMTVYCGPRFHLVHYPLRGGKLLNLVAVFHSKRHDEGWDAYGDPEELQARFEDACPEVKTLLAKIESWRMWVLCDRDPVKVWGRGRATLLGDAAHPMLQYLAQGACMAFEDGYVLAQTLADMGMNEQALRCYESKRYLRTGKCQVMARLYGDIFHAEGVVSELRDQLVSNRPPAAAYAGMEWLYRGV